MRTEDMYETPETNREGLTFVEWLAAALVGSAGPSWREPSHETYLAAWSEGEDPTEWAAARQRGGR